MLLYGGIGVEVEFMKIKLAILEKDISYLNRFINVFSTKYADKMEI